MVKIVGVLVVLLAISVLGQDQEHDNSEEYQHENEHILYTQNDKVEEQSINEADISGDQLQALIKLYEKYDEDKNGLLTKEQFIKTISQEIKDDEQSLAYYTELIDKFYQKYDTQNDGIQINDVVNANNGEDNVKNQEL